MKYADEEGNSIEVEGATIPITAKFTYTQAEYIHDAPEPDSTFIRKAVQDRMDRETQKNRKDT